MANRSIKVTKVEERKLGREDAMGLAYNEKDKDGDKYGEIHIDPHQTEREYLDTLIHERLHMIFPMWLESKVKSVSKTLAKFLWKQKYRRIRI